MRNASLIALRISGVLKLLLEMFRLVADHDVLVTGDADLDADDGWYRKRVLGALVDADPTGDDTIENGFELGHPLADGFFCPLAALDVVESDLDRHLHRPPS